MCVHSDFQTVHGNHNAWLSNSYRGCQLSTYTPLGFELFCYPQIQSNEVRHPTLKFKFLWFQVVCLGSFHYYLWQAMKVLPLRISGQSRAHYCCDNRPFILKGFFIFFRYSHNRLSLSYAPRKYLGCISL